MKNRAFVKYKKTGEIVPGSLIITQGGYPKGGPYKEITMDLCCDNFCGPSSSCDTSNLNLEQLLAAMNQCHEQVTSLFPNIVYFSDYGDGDTTYIYDGCDDMYDSANSFNTSLTQTYNSAAKSNLDFNLSIPYTHTQDDGSEDECDYTNPPMDGQIVSGTGYFNTATCSKYFTNMYPGMFMLAATGMNVTQFGIYGNLGSDGDSINQAYQELTAYPGWTVFLKTNNDDADAGGGSSDPNVTHIILLYGDLTNVAHAYDSTGNHDDDALVGLGPTNTAIISLTMATESGTGVIDIDVAEDIANKVLEFAIVGCTPS